MVIPAFFFFIGIEALVSLKKKKLHLFNFERTVSNLTVGLAERLLSLFLTASFYGLFVAVYENFALFQIPNHWAVWVLVLLVTDLIWYWYHRLSHEINLFWAAHVVHHQSEDFNFSVSARITVFQALIRNSFWCLLPLLGFHPEMVLATLVVHGTYSFFTHTQIIGNLGWLEKILITPTHHGVHHASNGIYLNKNYGDIFVFWDKLFGTFQEQTETPVYGLTHPIQSNSFLWQHFHYFLEMLEAARRTKGFGNKLSVVFGKPETIDQAIRPELEKIYLAKKAELVPKTRYRTYVVLQVAVSVVLLFFFTYYFEQTSLFEKAYAALFIIITLVNCGALLEQRKWIYYLEHIRVFVLACYVCYQFQHFEFLPFVAIALILSALPSAPRDSYFRFLYR